VAGIVVATSGTNRQGPREIKVCGSWSGPKNARFSIYPEIWWGGFRKYVGFL